MNKYLLAVIFLLALLLRLVNLHSLPTGFTPDEASFGYDAYSLLRTGRDQWGNSWPLVFKSFGDYKMPLYGYLAMPSIAMFGLNEFATRLPGALFGSFAVLATYFLARELFAKEKKGEVIALTSAFLLSISPWHVQLSRGAFEANLTTFFLTAGIMFFLKGLKNPKFFVISALMLGLNLFSYHSARILTPLIGVFMLLLYRKNISFKNTYTLIAALLGFLFVILTAYTYTLGAGARIGSSSIYSTADQSGVDRYYAVKTGLPEPIALAVFNKPLFLVEKLTTNYLSYFSPQFLFTLGPAEYTYGMLSGIGVLYAFEFLFLAFFLIVTFRKNLDRSTVLLLFWVFISPIPAALSVGLGAAANRAAILMPAIQIVSAIGALYLYRSLRSRLPLKHKQYLFIFGIIILVSFISFFIRYTSLEPAKGAIGMIYGPREIIANIPTSQPVFMTKKISEPQIYVAFYRKINPAEYQEQTKSWDMVREKVAWTDQLPVYSLQNVTFKNLDLSADAKSGATLIGTPDEFISWKKLPEKVITYPGGTVGYMIMHIP